MKKRLKIVDFAIFFTAAAVTAVSFIAAYRTGKGRMQLIIQTPAGSYAYDMTQDRDIRMQGAIGISEIEIKNGKARFVDSPCPNKTCIQSAPLSRAGDWSACLPNNVFMRIEASSQNDVDAISE